MKTKLTLSIDKDLVKFAHHQAHADGTSVSAMFASFLTTVKSRSERQSPLPARAMIGTLKAYDIDDSKSAVRAIYADKHFH